LVALSRQQKIKFQRKKLSISIWASVFSVQKAEGRRKKKEVRSKSLSLSAQRSFSNAVLQRSGLSMK
jgi:hypothetical protein